MSPSSPENLRHETAWVYSQGAPPTFKGDLHYYSVDHDLRGTAHHIDTSKVAVYVMCGEYDWSSTPAMARATASRIKGATYRDMPDLGHFPMSENPQLFLQYIRPVLDEIAGA
jgi:pimeloyl-ACP methyl ester carboxylesterase